MHVPCNVSIAICYSCPEAYRIAVALYMYYLNVFLWCAFDCIGVFIQRSLSRLILVVSIEPCVLPEL